MAAAQTRRTQRTQRTQGSRPRAAGTPRAARGETATDDFSDHPRVANGFSDILVRLWGENGKHCRSAVGMVSLPGNAAVEVEAIIEVA